MSSKRIVSCMTVVWREPSEILLVKRVDSGRWSGMWTLPGGRIDPGESWRHCAVRETLEETGVRLNVEDANSELVLHYQDSGGARVYYFSRWNQYQGDPVNREPKQHSAVAWFSLYALPDDMAQHLSLGIKGVMEGGGVMEAGFTDINSSKEKTLKKRSDVKTVRVAKRAGLMDRIMLYLFPPIK